MTSNKSHNEVIRDICDEYEWDFHWRFVQALFHPRAEYVDKPAIAYAFGADLEKTGKKFCPGCDAYFTDMACQGFRETIEDILRREAIEPYMQATCPECHGPIEDTQPASEIVFPKDPVLTPDAKTMAFDGLDYEENLMTQYKPCGCLVERGTELIRWDLDRDAVRENVNLLGYDGPTFVGDGHDLV